MYLAFEKHKIIMKYCQTYKYNYRSDHAVQLIYIFIQQYQQNLLRETSDIIFSLAYPHLKSLILA
jgi:hypothetical protein